MLHYDKFHHPTSTDWVTFIHGAGGSSSIWHKQIRAFKAHLNVLLVDLRGHGNSKMKDLIFRPYTFEGIAKDVIEVFDYLNIEKSHLVGISLGSIVSREIAEINPDRVSSLMLGGAVLQLNLKSKILMRFGVVFKNILPYMVLYKILAWVILPRKNHKKARLLFVNEARKLYQKEFIRWLKLMGELNNKLTAYQNSQIRIPTLYLMGSQDHLFLPAIEKISKAQNNSKLVVFQNCGHVVNIEQPMQFNESCLQFISEVMMLKSA